jgi:hypothetical protein
VPIEIVLSDRTLRPAIHLDGGDVQTDSRGTWLPANTIASANGAW